MKKETPIKYPHSANLFQFCRKVLDHKFGGIRVIDQDVGQILGFDPADCSHWKKGKKNIRSIQAMKSIAQHLGVDEKLVVDIANGEITDWEAFHEYTGYGDFELSSKVVDDAKKDFYRRHANTWTREKELEFKKQFDLNESIIDQIVGEIHEKIKFQEAPLYLPEIMAAYPDLALKPYEASAEETENATLKISKDSQARLVIEYPIDIKMRPYLRYKITKAMSQYFFEKANLQLSTTLGEHAGQITDIQANVFAAKLLTPAHLIRAELAKVNIAKDIVSQLADMFWVSKTFMNNRLKEILQRSPEI
jgi:hypothetical protein